MLHPHDLRTTGAASKLHQVSDAQQDRTTPSAGAMKLYDTDAPTTPCRPTTPGIARWDSQRTDLLELRPLEVRQRAGLDLLT